MFLLRHQDCSVLHADLYADTFDVAVTSPPYNIDKKDAGEFEFNMEDGEYMEWLVYRLAGVMSSLRPNGSLFLNFSGKPSKLYEPYRLVCRMLDMGYYLQNVFHWVKSISMEIDGETHSHGHFKPINSSRFVNDLTEPIFHFTRTGHVPLNRLAIGVPYQDKSNIARWEGARSTDLRCRGNLWFIPYETRQAGPAMPTMFPVDLPRMCIRLHGVRHPAVLDPFCGSGTTGVAAAIEGASEFVGIDRSQRAIQISRERLEAQHVVPELA